MVTATHWRRHGPPLLVCGRGPRGRGDGGREPKQRVCEGGAGAPCRRVAVCARFCRPYCREKHRRRGQEGDQRGGARSGRPRRTAGKGWGNYLFPLRLRQVRRAPRLRFPGLVDHPAGVAPLLRRPREALEPPRTPMELDPRCEDRHSLLKCQGDALGGEEQRLLELVAERPFEDRRRGFCTTRSATEPIRAPMRRRFPPICGGVARASSVVRIHHRLALDPLRGSLCHKHCACSATLLSSTARSSGSCRMRYFHAPGGSPRTHAAAALRYGSPWVTTTHRWKPSRQSTSRALMPVYERRNGR